MNKPLNKELQEFLIDRCDEIDVAEVSPMFKEADKETDRLYDELKAQLSDECQAMLSKYNDQHCYRAAAMSNVAYQRGFAECLQVILYLLTAK